MQPFESASRFELMSDAFHPAPENRPAVSTTQARQGMSGLGVRYVLAISLSAALAVLAIVYFVYASP